MKSTAALALALGLAYGFLPSALALGLEQKGRPELAAGSLPTYGLDVPTRTALKTVIPAGWQLFVHKAVKLPASVSWKPGDVWPQVLGTMATVANLSVLVDWDARTVLIRTEDVAVQEQATRAEIEAAASTPLPRFDVATKPRAPVTAAAAPETAESKGPTSPAAGVAPATALVAVAPSAPTYSFNPLRASPVALAPQAPAKPVVAGIEPAPAPIIVSAPVFTVAPAVIAAAASPSLQAQQTSPTTEAAAEFRIAELHEAPFLREVAQTSPPVAVSAPTPAIASPVLMASLSVPAAREAAGMPQATGAATPEPATTLAPRAVSVLEAFMSAPAMEETLTPTSESVSPRLAQAFSLPGGASNPAPAVKAARATSPALEKRKPIETRIAATSAVQPSPAPDQLARELAARAAPGTPTPYNDVMPTLSASVFAGQAAPVVAMLPATVPVYVMPAPAPAPTLILAPVAPPAPIAAPTAAPMPVIQTNPTPVMVAVQEAAAVRNPAKLTSTDKFSYVSATAMNKPSVRRVAQGIASKYGFRLVWSAPDVSLRGPVTLLAQSANEDLYLLKKALGPTNLMFELNQGGKTLVVGTSDVSYRPQLELDESYAQGASATTSGARPVESNPVGASAPAKLTLIVAASEPLENALFRFLRAQGYTYEWKVSGGFEAARQMTFEGDSVVQILSQVLPPLGVSADVYTLEKHIVVRPGEARDK